MHDPRNKKLADVFLDHSLKVKRGDKLVISTSDLGPIDLIRECFRGALQRGALVYLDVLGTQFMMGRSSAGDLVKTFFETANGYQLSTLPKPYHDIIRWADKILRITTIENKRHLAGVDAKKLQTWMRTRRPAIDAMIGKGVGNWALTYCPTQGEAQDAGMSYEDFVDFYYRSALVDYKKMEKGLRELERVIDRGSVVRIKGFRTDLTLGIRGRTGMPCFGQCNIPDGEIFTGPEEAKTEGYIYYDMPTNVSGQTVRGIYLEFKKGEVIKASAEENEDALCSMLATDPGAKRFGEFAIGANYNITKPMLNTLFDEKIGGTIHTALGSSYHNKKGWGKNKSAIHWDIVKDMRKKGSEVWIDKKLILKDGKILV